MLDCTRHNTILKPNPASDFALTRVPTLLCCRFPLKTRVTTHFSLKVRASCYKIEVYYSHYRLATWVLLAEYNTTKQHKWLCWMSPYDKTQSFPSTSTCMFGVNKGKEIKHLFPQLERFLLSTCLRWSYRMDWYHWIVAGVLINSAASRYNLGKHSNQMVGRDK